jgi:capsid protein
MVPNSKQYDGEKIPGDLRAWDYMGTDPNEMLLWTYDVLCQRSTTLYHTHPPVASAVNKLTQYAIGQGNVFRSQPDWETLGVEKDYAKDWGMRFQKLIHYVFLMTNWYEKQSIAFRTALIVGDSLVFFDREDDSEIPFDLIETPGDYINFQGVPKSKDQKATLGVIHDKAMRRKGLILNDGTETAFRDENKDQNVIQFYNKLMARQLRGYPLGYRIIALAKNNDRLWDATLARAVAETMVYGTSNEYSPESEFYDEAGRMAEMMRGERLGSATATSDTSLTRISGVNEQTPGGIYSYKGRGGIKFTDLKTPSNNFDKMQNAYYEMAGMAMDVPPEVLIPKYSTSFTAHKGAFNDFIKSYMLYRWKFNSTVNKTIIREAAKWLFINRLIEMPNPNFFDNAIIQEATIAGKFLGPVPGHINPKVEVEAKALEVQNAFDLRSNKALENGNEFDNMIEEWQQEESEWSKMSVEKQAETIARETAEQGEENDGQPDDDGTQTQEDEE